MSNPLNLILEVSGQKSGKVGREKQIKAETARTLWIPAINNAGDYGRWAFVEISDPWDLQKTVRAALKATPAATES